MSCSIAYNKLGKRIKISCDIVSNENLSAVIYNLLVGGVLNIDLINEYLELSDLDFKYVLEDAIRITFKDNT